MRHTRTVTGNFIIQFYLYSPFSIEIFQTSIRQQPTAVFLLIPHFHLRLLDCVISIPGLHILRNWMVWLLNVVQCWQHKWNTKTMQHSNACTAALNYSTPSTIVPTWNFGMQQRWTALKPNVRMGWQWTGRMRYQVWCQPVNNHAGKTEIEREGDELDQFQLSKHPFTATIRFARK